MRPILLTFFFFFSSLSKPAHAWWDNGHLLVALVAEPLLLPEVKKKVDLISLQFADAYPQHSSFCCSATWADDLKGQGRLHLFDRWHYTDNPFDPEQVLSKEQKDCIKAANKQNDIVWLLGQASKTLADRKSGPFEKGFCLKFLIHCVGDIHQPLHCSSRYSKKHPHGDLGGNLSIVQGMGVQNLHQLWDSGAGAFPKIDNPLKEEQLHALKTYAAQLSKTYPIAFFKEVKESNFKTWSLESSKLAEEVAYAIGNHEKPSDAYLQQAAEVCNRQVTLAGYRLANLLNRLLKEKQKD
ncbi:MAG: nuclease [Chlamydiales bacterium]|jgi:hypothetical protein|nr:nuclease [Chlamydiales bacterium]